VSCAILACPESLMHAQLATRNIISDVFSLCFGSVEGDGAFMVGDVDLLPHNVVLQYTPLVESSAHPHYYGVTLDAVAVGKKVLVVDKVKPCRITRFVLTRSIRHYQNLTLVVGLLVNRLKSWYDLLTYILV
jgi:hypothetical protein